MLPAIRQRLRAALDPLRAALPCCCALCKRSCGALLCADCGARYLSAAGCRCERCALRLPQASASPVCGACLAHPPAFDRTIVAADYAPPLDRLVLDLKFGAQLAAAPLFAALLHSALASQNGLDRPELLIPVPRGPSRLAERGFNQSLEIARELARRLGIALQTRLLVRTRDTVPQSLLPHRERRANVRRAFTLTPAGIALVRGRHVAVVDDVMTTGETMDAIAATLKRFGAARVSCLALARTPPK
jgi:ComF family protein